MSKPKFDKSIEVSVINKNIHTAMFVDYQDSTSEISDVTPDDAMIFLDEKLEMMVSAIEYSKGQIIRIEGDGVVAIFDGSQIVEHASSAVEAAKHIVSNFSDNTRDTRYKIRIGIDSGELIINNIKTRSGSFQRASGITTVIANRLESIAKPGEILISKTTYDLAKDNAGFGFSGYYNLKGVSSRIGIYSSRKDALVRHDPASKNNKKASEYFVHSSTLKKLLEQINSKPKNLPSIIRLAGGPGTGKSTLLTALYHSPELNGEKHLISLLGSHSLQPFALIKNLLCTIFEIDPVRKDESYIKAQFRHKILISSKQETDLVNLMANDSMGLTTSVSKHQVTRLLTDLFATYDQTETVIVIIDNSKYMDLESEKVLWKVFDQPAIRKRFTIILGVENQHRHHEKGDVNLASPDKEAKRRLVELWTQGNQQVEKLSNQVFEACGNNLHYLHLIFSSLAEAGSNIDQLVESHGSPISPSEIIKFKLKHVVQNRIKSLSENEIRILDGIVLYGDSIHLNIMQKVYPEINIQQTLLSGNMCDGLIIQRGLELFFTNDFIRTVLRQSMTRKHRQSLHSNFINVIRSEGIFFKSEAYSQLAYHSLNCGQLTHALKFNIVAARRSFKNDHISTSSKFYDNAISAIESEKIPDKFKPIYLKLNLEKLRIAAINGKSLDELEMLDSISSFLESNEIEDKELLAEFHCQRSIYLSHCGSTTEAIFEGNKAASYAKHLANENLTLKAKLIIGHGNYHRGTYGMALDSLAPDQANYLLGRSTRRAENNLYVRCLSVAAGCEIYRGQFEKSRDYLASAKHFCFESQNVLDFGVTCYFQSLQHRLHGEYFEAQTLLQDTLITTQKKGYMYLEPWLKGELGMTELAIGNSAKALALLRDAETTAGGIGLRYNSVLILCYLAEAYLMTGNIEAAKSTASEAVQKSLLYHYEGLYGMSLLVVASAVMNEDALNIDIALGYLEEARTTAERNDMQPLFAKILSTFGKAHHSVNQETSDEYLMQASRLYIKLGLIDHSLDVLGL